MENYLVNAKNIVLSEKSKKNIEEAEASEIRISGLGRSSFPLNVKFKLTGVDVSRASFGGRTCMWYEFTTSLNIPISIKHFGIRPSELSDSKKTFIEELIATEEALDEVFGKLKAKTFVVFERVNYTREINGESVELHRFLIKEAI